MPWSGKIVLRVSGPPKYLLDNDLSKDIAKALRIFHYDIYHISEPEIIGLSPDSKDPEIFKWCSANGRVWITHDIEARKKHAADLYASKISVLWVRGHPETSATWEMFKLIVRWIKLFQQKLTSSHGAIHYRITKGENGLLCVWAESEYDKLKDKL